MSEKSSAWLSCVLDLPPGPGSVAPLQRGRVLGHSCPKRGGTSDHLSEEPAWRPVTGPYRAEPLGLMTENAQRMGWLGDRKASGGGTLNLLGFLGGGEGVRRVGRVAGWSPSALGSGCWQLSSLHSLKCPRAREGGASGLLIWRLDFWVIGCGRWGQAWVQHWPCWCPPRGLPSQGQARPGHMDGVVIPSAAWPCG